MIARFAICVKLLVAVSALLSGPLSRYASAGVNWPDERTAGPFQVHADFSLAEHQPLLDELGQLQDDLRSILELAPAREPVHLFLFDKKTTYEAYLKRHFPRAPARRALFIKGRGPGMVFAYRGIDFEIDVRHESTHALLHASLDNLPLWLDEGLAEYFEASREKRAAENEHHSVIRTMARFSRLPQLEDLEAMTEIDEMGREEYRDSWAWVHFMLHGSPAAYAAFVQYLRDLQQQADTGPLSLRLRRQVPDLNQRMLAHFSGDR